jgi:phage-related minor tail protein
MAKDNVTRRISIYVNGKEVENSLKGVEGAMSHVRNKMRLLNKDSETYDKDSKELAGTMTQLKQKQSDYREELGLTNKTMKESIASAGDLRGALSGIWGSLVSGDLKGAKEGISSLTSGMGGLVKSTMAFITSPIGLAVAGLMGLVAGAKALFDYNKGLTELTYKLESLGVAADQISKVRSEIQATAETFDKDFNEIAEKANSLSKTYGISMSEANKIISDGLAEGGAYNDEFLDSLGEYDVFFKQAGYSATEFKDIINTGYDLGIYSDKLPDALKEADLALKENNKSTRDALVNAFGASFSDEILNKVKTGEITTKQALESIAEQSSKTQLSQQQLAQLTADVFKGAGEDVGGAAVVLQAVGEAANRESNKLGASYKNLQDANDRLNKAQSKLFEIEGFGDIWTGIKSMAISAMASMLEYISELKKDIQPLIDLISFSFTFAWEQAKLAFVTVIDIIGGVLKAFGSYFGGIVEGIKKLLQGDFIGAFHAVAEGIGNAFKNIGNIFVNLYNNVISFLTNLVDAAAPVLETLGVDVDKLKEKLEGLKGKKFEIKGEIKVDTKNTTSNTAENKSFGSGGGGASADAEKERTASLAKQKAAEEKAAKESYQKAKELADAKANLAKAQLDQYVFDLRANLDKEKALAPEIIAAETERLSKIKQAQIQFNNDELARKVLDLEAKAQLENSSLEVLNAQKKALNIEYLMKNQELELGFQISTDVLKAEYEEEQKVLKAEQLLLDNEMELELAASKYEEDKLKAEQLKKEELDRVLALYNDKKISKAQYDAWVDAIETRNVEIERQREMAKLQMQLGTFSQVGDALGAMFGQSKELAIVQAAISGAQAVISVWQAPAALPQPYDAIMKGVITAGVVASTVKQIGTIKNQKAPKPPKFFYGGATGNKAALGHDEYGPVTGYVHQNEYVIPEVMTQDPQFADTIGWLEHNRQKKLKGYVDGGETSPGTTAPSSQTAESANQMLVAAVNNLNAILASGIYAKVSIGYNEAKNINDLNTEMSDSNANGTVG